MGEDRAPDLLQRCRRATRPLVKAAARCVQRLDPACHRARGIFNRRPGPRTLLLCIYRARNAGVVLQLVDQAERAGAEIQLWALDEIAPSLAPWTCGNSAGTRTELLNSLWKKVGDASSARVVISDDDIVFTRGSLLELLNGCEYCAFGLAQPAHAAGSYAAGTFTRSRALTIARTTSWVESGPMLVISDVWVNRVLPFPPQAGMGWGLELIWGQLREEGCRLGIIDRICIRHLSRPHLEYDTGPEAARLAEMLSQMRMQSTKDAQQCLGQWMFWQSEPPWRSRVGNT